MIDTLEEIRFEIDEVDDQILRLLEKRLVLAYQAHEKRTSESDPDREDQVLRRLEEKSQLPDGMISSVYRTVIDEVRTAQSGTP